MKRFLLILMLVCLSAGLVAQTAGASSRYGARLAACRTSEDAQSGSLEVDATVAPIPGSVRMGLRFDLYRARHAGGRFFRVPAPRLSMWNRSGAHRASYSFAQEVKGLGAPAVYEMRVGFRWYSRTGRVLLTRYRATKLCHQPDRRPDLQVSSVTADAQNPTHYEAVLTNTGLTAAGPFSAVLRSRGQPLFGQTVPLASGLAAGESVTVGFDGPACGPGDTAPVVVVDSGDEVRESREGNNRRSCSF